MRTINCLLTSCGTLTKRRKRPAGMPVTSAAAAPVLPHRSAPRLPHHSSLPSLQPVAITSGQQPQSTWHIRSMQSAVHCKPAAMRLLRRQATSRPCLLNFRFSCLNRPFSARRCRQKRSTLELPTAGWPPPPARRQR